MKTSQRSKVIACKRVITARRDLKERALEACALNDHKALRGKAAVGRGLDAFSAALSRRKKN